MTSLHSLPARSVPFIGRENELDEISSLLSGPACRLVTLTGPGGIGKTCLALELLHQLNFEDGVYFIPLQPLRSGQHVLSAIIDVLPLQINNSGDFREQLIHYLHDKHTLLILDNFEHLLDGAELLVDIFAVARYVKILATSREPLNLREEWVRQLRGLDYPDSNSPPSGKTYSAVQLFVQRAIQQHGDFRLEDEAADIIHICQLVEGMPLAIELATAWVRTLACAKIADEIQKRIDFLTTNSRNIPERHRSMRAVFDHSWELLTPEEARVMRGFTVFRGGCTLDAAQNILDTPLHTLASLVDKSLLHHSPETKRYDIQELQRQYAEEQLDSSGEGDTVRDRHCLYYGAAFKAPELEEKFTRHLIIEAAKPEMDNLRATWIWALQRELFDPINQLLETLWICYNGYSATLEIAEMFEAACQQLAAANGESERGILGRVLARLGKCEAVNARFEQAEMFFRESMTIAQAQNDLVAYYYAKRWLAWYILGRYHHDYNTAQQMLQDCIVFFRQQRDESSLALALGDLAENLRATGEMDQAKVLYVESYQLGLKKNDFLAVITPIYLAETNVQMGLWAEARAWLDKAAERSQQGTSNDAILGYVSLSSWIAVMQGEFERARDIIRKAREFAQEHYCSNAVEVCAHVICSLSSALIADAGSASDENTAQNTNIQLSLLKQRGGTNDLHSRAVFVLGWTLCSLNRFDEAIGHIAGTLQSASENSFQVTDILCAIATGIRILAGRDTTSAIDVAELMGFIFTHPRSPQGYFERHAQLQLFCDALSEELGAEIYDAARTRGSQREIESVANQVLNGLVSEADTPDTLIKQPLIEILSKRELEIVQLLSDGLNSREIAERLVLSVGTIRWYMKEIYSKLYVHSRSEAIMRARALNLVL